MCSSPGDAVVKRAKDMRRLLEEWGCLCSWGQTQDAAGRQGLRKGTERSAGAKSRLVR